MRKLFFFILIVCTTVYIGAAHAALPDWILIELKKYPIEKYLFHVGESQGTEEQAFQEAVGDAHRRIASDILKNVDRVIRFNSELEHDIVREHYSAVLEDYCDSRQAWPAMKLKGFHVRNLNVDLARKDLNTYALVYIERKKLKEHYAEHVSELAKDINRLVDSAKSAEGAYEIDFAVKKYLQTYPLYEALKEAEIVQIGAEYKYAINSTEAFKRLVEAATGTSSSLKRSHREVIKRVAELDSPMIVFLDDIAKATEFQLSQQHSNTLRECWIESLIYEDSQTLCPYEQKFSEALLKHLDWPIVEPPTDFKPTPHDLARINRASLPNRITSSCWENGDEIKIRTTVRDPNTGSFLATAVVRLLKSQLRDKPIDFQPPDYESMRDETKGYDIPVIIGKELAVEVWTHQGRGPLRYTEDEKVKIFVQVNQPAYVRLLYTLADRRHTLLKDNYHIDAAKVNTAVEIGEFLCAAPFGSELLVAVARTEKFPDIEKRKEDGYFIVDGDPDSVRGLKVIDEPDPDPLNDEPQPEPTFQQNEAQIVVTTVAK